MLPKQEKAILAALKRAVKRLPKRPRVNRIKHEFGRDSFGDEAIHVWVVYEDEDFDVQDERLYRNIDFLSHALSSAAEKQGLPRMEFRPYIHVSIRSEEDEIDRAEVS